MLPSILCSSQLEMLQVNTDVGQSEITNSTLPGGKTAGQVAMVASCSSNMCQTYAAYSGIQWHTETIRNMKSNNDTWKLGEISTFSTFRNLDCGHNAAQPAVRAS